MSTAEYYSERMSRHGIRLATAHLFVRAVVTRSALFRGVSSPWTGRRGRGELQELNGCSIVKYERHTNSSRRLVRRDQNLPTFEGFVQVVDGKGDVRNGSDDRGHVAMRLEPDPLDSVRTRLKTGDVNSKVRDMELLRPRLRVWNPDVVVPPSELGGHDGRLMFQSLFHHPCPFVDHRVERVFPSSESAEDDTV